MTKNNDIDMFSYFSSSTRYDNLTDVRNEELKQISRKTHFWELVATGDFIYKLLSFIEERVQKNPVSILSTFPLFGF